MNDILTLREKRANLWDAAKKFLNDHTNENGLMSAEDSAQYERMEQDIVNIGKSIERLERAASMDSALNAAVDTVLSAKPGRVEENKTNRATDAYKNAFWASVRDRVIRPEVRDALQIGTNSEGGYLVPDEFEKTLVDLLTEENALRGLCTVIRTESGSRKIPVVASHGDADWTDEEAAYHNADDAFDQVSLGAHKLTTIMKVSEELLNDSVFNLENYIGTEFARRCGTAEEAAFVAGNGTGKPTGILSTASGVRTALKGVTAAAADKFTADEVLDLVYSVKQGYRKNASFLMNDSTVKALRKLKDGNGQYLWQPGLREGEPDTLLGYKITTSAAVASIATKAKVMAFGDFKYYWIADREGRTFQRLNELYAANGQVGFRAYERVDGKLIVPEAIKFLEMA